MRVSILFVLLVLNLNVVQAASKIASYNIRNFDYDERSHTPTNKFHLVRTLGALDADLIAVQEINNVHYHLYRKFYYLFSPLKQY